VPVAPIVAAKEPSSKVTVCKFSWAAWALREFEYARYAKNPPTSTAKITIIQIALFISFTSPLNYL
jgi:uncharacterized membrane protein YwzB